MSAIAVRIDRDFLDVRGPDASSYLHSQLSQDITALAVGETRWSFLLQPTGKVEALLRVTHTGDDSFLLDFDGGFREEVIARINRFKIRVKADITALDWQCVAVRGGADDAAYNVLALPIAWRGVDGVDLVGESVAIPANAAEGTLDDYEALRIEAGWPAMGAELTDATIPGETGLTDIAVSFTKGCYPGQELVERIDSRGGNVARHLRRLRSTGATLESGTHFYRDGKDVGWVTSAHGDTALGYVSRTVEPPADVDAGGIAVEVLG